MTNKYSNTTNWYIFVCFNTTQIHFILVCQGNHETIKIKLYISKYNIHKSGKF